MPTTLDLSCELLTPRVSSLAGNAFWNVIGLTALDSGHLEFVKDVDGKAYYKIRVPKNLNATPNAKIGVILKANATSGVCRLKVSSKAVADDAESLNPASLTAETSQDITVPATAYLSKRIIFPTSGSLAETVAADDYLLIELFHEGAHANDTLAVNSLIEDVFLRCDVG